MRTWKSTSWWGRNAAAAALVGGAVIAGGAVVFQLAQPVGAQGRTATYIETGEVTVELKHGPGGGVGLDVACNDGDTAIGGGFTTTSSYIKLIRSYPRSSTTWNFAFVHHGRTLGLGESNPNLKPHDATGYVVCLKAGGS